MDKYVASLEPSKELYRRGIIANSQFFWAKDEQGELYITWEEVQQHDAEIVCPAPILSELMTIAPEMFIDELGYHKHLEITKDRVKYGDIEEVNIKVVDALVSLLIWLDDNGYLNDTKS